MLIPLALISVLASAVAPQPPPSPEPHAGLQQELGLGYSGNTFSSSEGSQFTFHAASLTYAVSFRERGIFLQGSVLLPFQGRQDGRVYTLSESYGTHTGGDLLVGWQWRFQAFSGLEVEAGPGLHLGLLILRGRPGYTNFSALPLGPGGAGKLRWNTGARIGSWPFTLALSGSAAFDVYDPAHANDLRHGFTFAIGVLAGLQGN